MLEELDEDIECKIHFREGTMLPLDIKWQTKWYPIKKVLLRWEERRGRELLRHFSVTDGANVFHIAFYPENLMWKLHGVDRGE